MALQQNIAHNPVQPGGQRMSAIQKGGGANINLPGIQQPFDGGTPGQGPVQSVNQPAIPNNQYAQTAPQQQQYVPQTGLIGAEQALNAGLGGALGGLGQGYGMGAYAANNFIGGGINGANAQIGQGVAGLQPFANNGLSAQDRQAALSGAMGPDAQKAAFQSFMDSPEQAYLRQRGDLAVTRNASALGGLGGGRVQQELQRQGVGLAAQDFQNQYNRLGFLSNQGLQAQGQIGQLYGQGAGITGQLSGQGANIMAQLGSGYGNNAADLFRGTGRDLASGRTRAGEQIAGNIGGTTSALSNLQNQQGTGLSGILGQTGGNLANLLSGAGVATGNSQQQLGSLLGNIATQNGSQIAGLPSIPGYQSNNIIGQAGQLASGIGTGISAYQNRNQGAGSQTYGPLASGYVPAG